MNFENFLAGQAGPPARPHGTLPCASPLSSLYAASFPPELPSAALVTPSCAAVHSSHHSHLVTRSCVMIVCTFQLCFRHAELVRQLLTAHITVIWILKAVRGSWALFNFVSEM